MSSKTALTPPAGPTPAVAREIAPGVPSPVGVPLSTLLAKRGRRQSLPGFDADYSDIVDFILRCTHRIWEEKNVGLCRTHYARDAAIHTLAGPVFGAAAVTENTIATLAGFPDRTLIGENVIWSEDAPGRFHTSHRIMSRMTHGGDNEFGPATGRRALVMTIADCVCEANRIVEEWLVRDNLWLVRQLGLDPRALALTQAQADQVGDQGRHDWRRAQIARLRDGGARSVITQDPAIERVRAMMETAIRDGMFGLAATAMATGAEGQWPSGRRWFGRAGWIDALCRLVAPLSDIAFAIDHVAANDLPADERAVAIRWSLTGRHARAGAFGQPTGRDILVMAVSHYRIAGETVMEDCTIFDELAIWRQVAGGLGA